MGLLQVGLSGGAASDLVRGAEAMRARCAAGIPAARNPGLYLGAFLGIAAAHGIERLGVVADPPYARFAEWLATDLAAKGVGNRLTILPALPVQLALGDAAIICMQQKTGADNNVREWRQQGTPVLVLQIEEGVAGLGAEMVRWEMGAAVAAHLLGVQPFQIASPASQFTRMLGAYRKKRKLDFPKPAMQSPAATAWTTGPSPNWSAHSTLAEVADATMRSLTPGQTLLLGLYRGATASSERAIRRVAQAVGEGLGVDCIVWFGASPHRAIRPGKVKAMLLSVELQTKAQVPELGVEYGILEQMQALADMAELHQLGAEVSTIHLKSEESFQEFVWSLESAARR